MIAAAGIAIRVGGCGRGGRLRHAHGPWLYDGIDDGGRLHTGMHLASGTIRYLAVCFRFCCDLILFVCGYRAYRGQTDISTLETCM